MQYLFLIVFFGCAQIMHAQDLCNNTSVNSEKGLAGIIDGKKIFFEIWTTNIEWRRNVILLRTDTSDISDSVYFCLDQLFGGDPAHSDSIFVSVSSSDTIKMFYTKNLNDIPTLIQILDFHYGNEQYAGFNEPNSGYSIKIKRHKLLLHTLSCSSRYDDRFEIKRKYKYRNGQFILLRTRSKIVGHYENE